jgi:hypothetical protein
VVKLGNPIIRFAGITLLLLLSGCNPLKPGLAETQQAVIAKDLVLPGRVAILPFENATSNPDAGKEVRKIFYNYFSSLNYRDAELYAVDQSLTQYKLRDKVIQGKEFPWNKVCQRLNIDGFITGKVNQYGKVYALLYTQTQVAIEVQLRRCSDGGFIWQDSAEEVERDGDIPLTPTGLAAALVTTYVRHRNSTALQVAAKLSMSLTARIPNPITLLPVPPKITLMVHNAAGQLLQPGDHIRIVLIGEPGQKGYWDIPDIATGLPLQEKERGIYIGQYRVRPNDKTNGAQLISYLVNNENVQSRWVDVMAPIAMGTPTKLPNVVENRLVLTVEQSPYLISGIVLVKSGASLIIKPGTTIWSDGLGFIVKGRILAEGEKNNQIRFDSVSREPWKGITIANDNTRSYLKHVEIRNADIALNTYNAVVDLSGLIITNNNWGIVARNTKLTLNNSVIRDSKNVGISARNSSVEMRHNHITNNEAGGVQFKGSTADIKNNGFFNNGNWDLKNTDETNALNASNNWWGTTDEDLVRTAGLVTINPILTESPDMSHESGLSDSKSMETGASFMLHQK